MRTLIVSDLHLGSRSGADLLRRAELRAPLLEVATTSSGWCCSATCWSFATGRCAMRWPPRGRSSRISACARGRVSWCSRRQPRPRARRTVAGAAAWRTEPPPLGVEQLLEPAQASPALARIAGWVAPARMRVAYPGLWVRPDVYATHGHYLDSHLTIPTLERLSVGAMARLWQARERVRLRGRLRGRRRADVRVARQPSPGTRRTGAVLNGATTSAPGTRSEGRGAGQPCLAHAAALAAPPRDRCRLPAGGGRAEPRRDRPAEREHLDERAASRGAARDGRGRRARRSRRRLCGLRPHPPGRARFPATRARVARARWRAAREHRQLDVLAAFVTRTPGESPYWPGTYVLRRGRRAADCRAPAAGPHARADAARAAR